MYPIDFVSYYSFEYWDFVLENDNLDFSLDNSHILDFNIVDNEIVDFTVDYSQSLNVIDFTIDYYQIIDFVGYYGFEYWDFILENNNLDFSLNNFQIFDFNLVDNDEVNFTIDYSHIIDFQLDITTPVEEYDTIFGQYIPAPDNVVVYSENYLITEDDIPMTAEDGYYLIY